MSDIEIEIDGKVLKAKPNSMVIQVADEAGIYIPRFCYHKHLSIAANCRMCLVEVEKAPKTLPACATPVMPGMKIFTRSPKALAAQKAVMEFLLINHPLDCPICDQGGECELQDLSMGFGSAESFYTFGKRSVEDEDIGPLIDTEMTRCIQCTRCVRFGDEVAGLRELGATDRGENMEIGTYVQKAMRSEVSGNIIDLCPVGALTSKPFRFTARAWELNQTPTIAAHDCLGSNIYAHTRSGKVMRIVPHENTDINQTWISDRDRFSYEGLYHPDRLEKPMVRVEGQWKETDWQTALDIAVSRLQSVMKTAGGNEIAALASPNSTLEEFYLLQKLMRQIGSPNVDHRLRETDFSDQNEMPLFPGLPMSFADIETADVIVLIGSNIQREQPIAGLRVRKATQNGARVIAINMMDEDFHFTVSAKKIVAPHRFVETLTNVVNALSHPDENYSAITDRLRAGKKICVLVGIQAFHHPKASHIRALAQQLADVCQGTVGFLTEGANAAGAYLAGAIPHRGPAGKPIESVGLNAHTVWKNPRKAYVLLNVEPELDSANAPLALAALEQADCVVSLSLYKNPVLMDYAHVILPVTPFTETAGTFVNVMGQWQRFSGVATPVGEARPAWKVLRVLGNLLDCEGFDYESAHEVHDEVKGLVDQAEKDTGSRLKTRRDDARIEAGERLQADDLQTDKQQTNQNLSRVGEIPIYAGDSIQRRAKALQATQVIIQEYLMTVRLHPETAKRLQVNDQDRVMVSQQNHRVRLPVRIDERVPVDAACIASGILATGELSELYGPVELHKTESQTS
ncbi:MAG TPA: NADH-quinone oxidoreductase subunit NuoG [Gammaproteobacteria bacterium]|nr:NADH-quinone oxidoreductase subunit NuoG [Gammaproteobacteria bacterium]